MPDDILYLDVLPLRTAEEAGGFSRAAVRRRGVAVAATLSSSGEIRVFRQNACRKLVEHLRSAKLVVGFNCIAFDYELIRGRIAFRRPQTVDLMIQLSDAAERRVSLREAAKATFGRAGLAAGNSLVEAWREGASGRVARSLRRKLGVLRRLHEHVTAHGWFAVMHEGKQKRVSVCRATDSAVAARRSMFDAAAHTFASTGGIPRLLAVQNPATGRAHVVSGGYDCENGMIREIGAPVASVVLRNPCNAAFLGRMPANRGENVTLIAKPYTRRVLPAGVR